MLNIMPKYDGGGSGNGNYFWTNADLRIPRLQKNYCLEGTVFIKVHICRRQR